MTDAPVAVNADIRVTVSRIQALKKMSGLSFTECMQSGDDEVRFRAHAFMELYRRDTEAGLSPEPDDLWDRAAQVEMYFELAAPRLDPTSGPFSTTSPPSAATGG
jgi:hypothetical protein